MRNLAPRAHLPAVHFAPRAYMGCGGWDLAQAPETAVASVDQDGLSGRASSRALGCGGGGYAPTPIELTDPEEPALSGARRSRVVMGCGDEPCEECAAKAAAGMGCTKCKRIRQRAMNNDELEGTRRLGQISGLPDTSILVVSSLAVAGLFYLATR